MGLAQFVGIQDILQPSLWDWLSLCEFKIFYSPVCGIGPVCGNSRYFTAQFVGLAQFVGIQDILQPSLWDWPHFGTDPVCESYIILCIC